MSDEAKTKPLLVSASQQEWWERCMYESRIEGAEAMKVANLLTAKPFHKETCGCEICFARRTVARDIGNTDAREVVATP